MNLETLKENATNYNGILIELSQKLNFTVCYNLVENEPNQNKVILCINDQPVASSTAKTRKKAEQKAAKKILNSPQLESIVGPQEEE